MYHYTQCGLPNVWLENGYTLMKTAYGKAVSVDDAQGLHRVLALSLLDKPGRLTGKELKFLRLALELSQESLGRLIGVADQSVSLWERTGKVPQSADSLTRLLVSERLRGNAKVMETLDRINTVERILHQRFVAREQGRRWVSKVSLEVPA